ncbi:MAG: EFR1 family ferrodoxin [Lachnospiraceae bacterium]|nr:EFR1 family ferrodoxin [Lachnospiraceae bacterium]
MPDTIHAVSFSPAGKTKKVVSHFANLLGEALALPVKEDSFTLPAERERVRSYGEDDLVVFGVPTYAGRIPNKALPFVQELFRAECTKTVAIVTFGNRSFDNALAELVYELKNNGFHVIGAAAVVCAHSFAQIGTGRPDANDRKLLAELAKSVADTLKDDTLKKGHTAEAPSLHVPGGEPPWEYYQPHGIDGEKTVFLKAKPVVDPALCDRCGICAAACPMGSIPSDAPDTTTGICIKCQACVKLCPHAARSFDDAAYLSHKAMLEQTFSRPAVTQIFSLQTSA